MIFLDKNQFEDGDFDDDIDLDDDEEEELPHAASAPTFASAPLQNNNQNNIKFEEIHSYLKLKIP